jgi:hypothetical protein
MQSVSPEALGEFQAELKRRFDEFTKVTPASKKRRYPQALKELVRQAREKGLSAATIIRLSGLSLSAVHRYANLRESKEAIRQPRRLAVVDTRHERIVSARIVIRLASGVAIELSDGRALNFDLLKDLSALGVREVSDASAR